MDDNQLITLKFKTLETPRLHLEAPDVKYAIDVYEYSKDKEFCKFITAKPAIHIDESVQFLEYLIQENTDRNRAYWVVVDKKKNKAVGTMGFIFSLPIQSKLLEFGYGLSRLYWGTGIFQEAAKEVLKFGFDTLKIEKVQVFTRADNIASIKGVQKVGFVQEAVLENYYETDIGRKDSVMLRLLRSEFMRIFK